MPNYRRFKSSITNNTQVYGIMGGLVNRRRNGTSSMNRATSRLTIPSTPVMGLRYMKIHNLLSKNPQGSGGVGAMSKVKPCGPCFRKKVDEPSLTLDESDISSGTSDIELATTSGNLDCTSEGYGNCTGVSSAGVSNISGCFIDSCSNFCCTAWDNSNGCTDASAVCQMADNISLCNGPTNRFEKCPASPPPHPSTKMYSCVGDDDNEGKKWCVEDICGVYTAVQCNDNGSCCEKGTELPMCRRRTCTKGKGGKDINVAAAADITWYGSADNCPPGPNIDGQLGGGVAGAGGIGTWEDPITMAYATGHKDISGQVKLGECIYVKELHKYFIYEDTCQECRPDREHYDLWMGPSHSNSKYVDELIDCEVRLSRQYQILKNPSADKHSDTQPIFDTSCSTPGEKSKCTVKSGRYVCNGGDVNTDAGTTFLCGNTCQIPCELSMDVCLTGITNDWCRKPWAAKGMDAAAVRGDSKWRCEDLAGLVGMSYEDFYNLNPVDPHDKSHGTCDPHGDPCTVRCPETEGGGPKRLYEGGHCTNEEKEDCGWVDGATFCMGDCCAHIKDTPKHIK